MNDNLTELERAMRARAAEVPSLLEPPATMLARARRRMARNALTAVVAIGLIVVGASAGFAGLGAFGGPDHQRPAGHPGGPIRSCAADDLHAQATLGGAAGSVVGAIDLRNAGTRVCTLTGRPIVGIEDPAGHPVSVRVNRVESRWQADGAPRPSGWPIVRLRPGSVAAIRVAWSNACPQLRNRATWSVDLGGGKGTLVVGGVSPPPCNGATEPSTLEVGPFEPGTT